MKENYDEKDDLIKEIEIENEGANSEDKDNDIKTQKTRLSAFSDFLRDFFSKDEGKKQKVIKKSKSINISSINPLRDMRKLNKSNINIREKAIMELIVDLKGQYILFNIRDFIRKYQIRANPNINTKKYVIIKYLRNFLLLVYGVLIFFERPWFCYHSATIPLPSFFEFKEHCNNVAFVDLPFIPNITMRIIEIFITITFIITQFMKLRNENYLKNTNTRDNKSYNKIQIILFICLSLCLVDLIIAIITSNFPIINFTLRAFIYVYMIRRVRNNWVRIGKILWHTKTVFLFLSMNIFLFSMIGYILFKRKDSQFFNSFIETVFQLYILLSTCNFPDIMFDTFTISKLAIFYFIIYVCVNYFIILSYLKTLYYTKYYKVNKEECLDIIKSIIQNKFNEDIFTEEKFKRFILDQKYKYSLSKEEFNNVLILLNLNQKNNDLFTELTRKVDQSSESLIMINRSYTKIILESKIYELIINGLCLLSLLIELFANTIFLIIQFIFSFLLLFEIYPFVKGLGIKKFFTRHFNRALFHAINIILIFSMIYVIIVVAKSDETIENNNEHFRRLKILISLRTIRVFVFLDKFRVIKNIYSIVRNTKEMFLINIFTLYSLFLLFSTFSMLLTGGNIEKKSFDDNQWIPNNYVYVNFNEYASSFIACFCLLMINNLNILVKSLTFHINRGLILFQFYFATFYFFSTLILIKIIQTLLLELYLNSNFSISDTKESRKEDKKIEEANEDDEESDDNETKLKQV